MSYETLKRWCEQGYIGCLCPPKNATKKEASQLWEELHYYNPRELDQLGDQLSGHEKISATKESALKRLRPLLEKIYKGPFDDPEHIVRERSRTANRAVKKGLSSPLEIEDTSLPEEETTMSTVTIKTPSKKSATKPNVKALKKANPTTTKSLTDKSPGRPGKYAPEQKITVVAKENPRREGTDVYDQFEILKKSKTVGDYQKKGGRMGSLVKSVKKGWAKVH